jgi:hypothetical protein
MDLATRARIMIMSKRRIQKGTKVPFYSEPKDYAK